MEHVASIAGQARQEAGRRMLIHAWAVLAAHAGAVPETDLPDRSTT
ncbi:MAG: hypothetical protein LC789_14610 [Actinobacteria bacterium]|nr:hypothetical protein [Actinomycetota bacterium]MCA1721338.1 hypothetical protein [Actinomycetota bacterium]